MSTLSQVFTVVSGLGTLGTLAVFFYVREMRRKLLAEAKKLEVEPEVLLSQQAMDMFDRVVRQLRTAEAKNERLEAHVRELEVVLRQHNITPPPWPPLKVVGDD